MDPDTFNKIRIGADFELVMKNILDFLDIKEKYGYKHVHTRTSMTIIEQGIDDLDKFKITPKLERNIKKYIKTIKNYNLLEEIKLSSFSEWLAHRA